MVIQPKQATKEDLRRKFEAFKADNTYVDRLQNQNLFWLQPGFIVQLFVADFSEVSTLAVTDSYYKRYTGIAKVLACSNENMRVADVYSSIKPGDIIYLGDDLFHVTLNAKWADWDSNQGRGQVKGIEPLKYIRKFHRWIEAGMLYLVDRSKETIEKEGIEINLSTIGDLKVPMIFRLPVQDVLFKIENPFD